MKHRIPLNDANRQILIEQYGVPPERLTREYWIRQIMNNQIMLLEIVEQRRGSEDLQRRINNKAGRLLRKYIRDVVGLPKPHGDRQRQREYLRILKTTGLIIPGTKSITITKIIA